MSARPRLGDILELPLPNNRGLAYVQYVNHHREPPRYGALIRVLPDIHNKRPTSFATLAAGPERHFTFFPLGPAVHRGYLTIVDHQPIPHHAQAWPIFKTCNTNYHTGEKTWYLCEHGPGSERRVGTLEERYHDCPMRQLVNLTALEDRIISNWHPRDEVHRVVIIPPVNANTPIAPHEPPADKPVTPTHRKPRPRKV